jgi:hypothetical protein
VLSQTTIFDEQKEIDKTSTIGRIQDFYYDVLTVESNATFIIPITYYPDGIPEDLRFGIIDAENPDARYEFIINNIEKQPPGIIARINNIDKNPSIMVTTEITSMGRYTIGLMIANDTDGIKQLHQYQITVENTKHISP